MNNKPTRLYVMRTTRPTAYYNIAAHPMVLCDMGWCENEDGRTSAIMEACPEDFEEATGIELDPGDSCMIEVRLI